MITRGTTPYHTFLVPLAPNQIQKVHITYQQNGKVIFDKTNKDIDIKHIITTTENAEINGVDNLSETQETNSQITLHLTQSDTLKFEVYPAERKNIILIQLRILDSDGEAYASEIMRERVCDVLKNGTIKS